MIGKDLCTACKGTGREKSDAGDDRPCHVCAGKNAKENVDPPGNPECPACKGMGVVDGQPCLKCDGLGFEARAADPSSLPGKTIPFSLGGGTGDVEECPRCDGTGYDENGTSPNTCPLCNGSGVAGKDVSAAKQVCPDCNGNGRERETVASGTWFTGRNCPTCEGTGSIFPAGKAIAAGSKAKACDLPDIRQNFDYDCGPTAVMTVCKYLGVGPATEEEYITALGTTPEAGTPPEQIEPFLRSLGLPIEYRNGMEIRDLLNAVQSGNPVIVCIQDYEDSPADIALLNAGHYVVVSDVILNGDYETNGTIKLQDPSAGLVSMNIGDFLTRWQDRDNEHRHINFGIIVGGIQNEKDVSFGYSEDSPTVEIPMMACDQCHGTGEIDAVEYVPTTCPNCNGQGYVVAGDSFWSRSEARDGELLES